MLKIMMMVTMILYGIAYATAGPPDTLHEKILSIARQEHKGVILAVTERGEVAAETAWLLSAQVIGSKSHTPFLLALMPEEKMRVLAELGLRERSLPALIYYDHSGREVSRIIGVMPSRNIKTLRVSSAPPSQAANQDK